MGWGRVLGMVGAAMLIAGCEAPARTPSFAAQAALLRERDLRVAGLQWQNAALDYELQLRNAQLRESATAVQFVRKLEELMALNSDLSARLSKAETALETIAAERSPEETPASLRAQLEELHSLRQSSEERAEAYRQLLRSFQALVDSGRIRATFREGRVHFDMPRPIDQVSPWN